jgi:hypothetical protein
MTFSSTRSLSEVEASECPSLQPAGRLSGVEAGFGSKPLFLQRVVTSEALILRSTGYFNSTIRRVLLKAPCVRRQVYDPAARDEP